MFITSQTRIFSVFHLFLVGRNTLSLTVPVCCLPRIINQMIALSNQLHVQRARECGACILKTPATSHDQASNKTDSFFAVSIRILDLTHDNHHAWAKLVHQWSCYCHCLNFYRARSFPINITQRTLHVQLQCCLHNCPIHHGLGSRR